MTSILAAYFLGLLYFTANPEKVSSKGSFRTAWIWYALIPINNFVFTLFRASNIRSPRKLALVEIWSNGLAWLLLGISLFILLGALMPSEDENAE